MVAVSLLLSARALNLQTTSVVQPYEGTHSPHAATQLLASPDDLGLYALPGRLSFCRSANYVVLITEASNSSKRVDTFYFLQAYT